ncbi:RagB/SusD family nutrient uptake outer membrane protein, partial [Flagellimonas flava]|uniref:RagB/SusD family nutrient uptake outer membrane protein n=1 Tax=Flagellimonas flava TaxID=570519 RepID=UPI003D65B97C
MGEAKFLRAYYYFLLVTGFENVPLVTTYEVDPDNLFPGQATPAEVWAQIETDLGEAESPMLVEHSGEWLGRATHGAAGAL